MAKKESNGFGALVKLMADKERKIAAKEELCKSNRTGQYIDDLPEFADSGLRLYEKNLELSNCRECDSSTSHKGKKYCLLTKNEYE